MIEAINKNFSELNIGDRVITQAKIIQIKEDQKNPTPKWYLLTLNDGTKNIRLFINDLNSFKVGDAIEIDFSVREGKPYNGNPQLAFNVNSSRKLEEVPEKLIDKTKIILRKEDIKECSDDQKIKIYTRVITLKPKGGERAKNQKILVRDIENRPIRVWVSKKYIQKLEDAGAEYFILQATVKKMQQYDSSILSLNYIITGDEALKDESARLFYENRIRYYSEELLKCLKIMKKHYPKTKINNKTVTGILANYRNGY